jgi:hypothetical protein
LFPALIERRHPRRADQHDLERQQCRRENVSCLLPVLSCPPGTEECSYPRTQAPRYPNRCRVRPQPLRTAVTGWRPVLHRNRRCLAARPRRRARGEAGPRWGERADPHRGNRYHVRDLLEGPLSYRGTRLSLFRQRQRPRDDAPRLPDRSARPDRLTRKFQISLVRSWHSIRAGRMRMHLELSR